MGTRPVGSRFSIVFRDHPHACGDKLYHRIFDLSRGGSSPRVWGQAEFRLRAFCSSRIIPTRVGTSDEELMNELKKRDHPHACGDKGTRRLNRSQSPGSSPRVWGQVASWNAPYAVSEDHPHAYGDKSLRTLKTARLRGSSPRVWGQGISGNMNAEIKRDHPHAYGDKFLPTVATLSTKGSSPRVWGQVLDKSKHRSLVRIIPTRMGTRLSERLRCEGFGDHPHAYGDKVYHNYHLHEE